MQELTEYSSIFTFFIFLILFRIKFFSKVLLILIESSIALLFLFEFFCSIFILQCLTYFLISFIGDLFSFLLFFVFLFFISKSTFSVIFISKSTFSVMLLNSREYPSFKFNVFNVFVLFLSRVCFDLTKAVSSLNGTKVLLSYLSKFTLFIYLVRILALLLILF